MILIRPSDATETVEAWRCAPTRADGPVGLVLTRQKLRVIELDAHARLVDEGIRSRVVSMPCWEFFEAQPQVYTVLPPSVRARVSARSGGDARIRLHPGGCRRSREGRSEDGRGRGPIARKDHRLEHTVALWLSDFGAPALFALLAVGVVGLPLPDETLLAFAGVLIGQGRMHAMPAAAAAIGGAITGITLSYGLGRFAGLPLLLRYGSRLHVDADAVARVRAWYDRGGKWLLAGGYFIPGARHVTAILAGASKLSVGTFMAFAYVGATLWASCFLTIGYAVGDHWRRLLADVHRHLMIGGLIAGTILAGYVYVRARRPV